jgi:hypothetical protein
LTSKHQDKKNHNRPHDHRHRCILAAVLAIATSVTFPTRAADAGEEPNFFSAGRPILELRPRYNRIDETDKPERTEGFTYRAIAGWATAPYRGWRFTVEGINTGHMGPKEFNDNGADFATSPYPLLPDPSYTGLNQAFVEYSGLASWRFRGGRLRMRIDNQRWISDNDFRQIPQLFDGAEVVNRSLPDTELQAAYFTRQRTTSGDRLDIKLGILHAAWNPIPGHSLAAYGYFHDQPVNGAFTGFANSSYKAYGVRAEGAFRAGDFEIPYTAEYARQKPYAGGNALIDVDYWRLGGGIAWRDLVLRYDEELRGSNNGRYGLQMPLTDFYGFNGWTLHFFNAPFQGLHDRWVTLRAGYAPWNLLFFAEGHKFRSDFRDLDFGRETDVGLQWSFWEGATLRLQHARYEPGGGQVAPSIHKTWITLTYTY